VLTVTSVFEAIWQKTSQNEEKEALGWMQHKLESTGKLVFDDEMDVRGWVLDHKNLVEPDK
jgi:hypothetical protein